MATPPCLIRPTRRTNPNSPPKSRPSPGVLDFSHVSDGVSHRIGIHPDLRVSEIGIVWAG
ncbi:MAG: hypothetical protein LBH48_08470 [Bifidobacteriaceae bacterium]|nr:hypothetical protein [Bifidobacteriaceae bacterium]